MAAYVPATFITQKIMGSGSAQASSWAFQQSTAVAGSFGIVRSMVFSTPSASRSVSVQVGLTSAATTAERVLDALALTANVPYPFNGWYTLSTGTWLIGFGSTTDIVGGAYGYAYS